MEIRLTRKQAEYVREAHHRWKEIYGGMIEKKAIFDCE